MAAKFANASVLDGGLLAIKNGATKMILVSAYTFGDTYATVVANTLATVTMAAADFVISSSGNNRVLTTGAGKSATATATAGGTPDLQIAFTDGVGVVLWVTDETSNQPITSGNTVNFPSLTYTSNQPT
jgi:hypothetical protein